MPLRPHAGSQSRRSGRAPQQAEQRVERFGRATVEKSFDQRIDLPGRCRTLHGGELLIDTTELGDQRQPGGSDQIFAGEDIGERRGVVLVGTDRTAVTPCKYNLFTSRLQIVTRWQKRARQTQTSATTRASARTTPRSSRRSARRPRERASAGACHTTASAAFAWMPGPGTLRGQAPSFAFRDDGMTLDN